MMANTEARKERIRVKRMAALQDIDYAVLACARMGTLTKQQRAVVFGKPVFSWFLRGEKVDANLRRLHKLGWLRLYPDQIRFMDDAT